MEPYWEPSGHVPHPVKYESDTAGFAYCGENGLNFSTSSAAYSEDDAEFITGRRGKASRQDPLSHRIIEKRRRDRMNSCLADLSRLIPPQYQRKGRGRIEKTEIIEMSIRYMKQLQHQEYQHKESGFKIGYDECVQVAANFLYHTHRDICYQLVEHLKEHSNDFIKDSVSASSGSPHSMLQPHHNYHSHIHPYHPITPLTHLREMLSSDMDYTNDHNDDVKDLSFRSSVTNSVNGPRQNANNSSNINNNANNNNNNNNSNNTSSSNDKSIVNNTNVNNKNNKIAIVNNNDNNNAINDDKNKNNNNNNNNQTQPHQTPLISSTGANNNCHSEGIHDYDHSSSSHTTTTTSSIHSDGGHEHDQPNEYHNHHDHHHHHHHHHDHPIDGNNLHAVRIRRLSETESLSSSSQQHSNHHLHHDTEHNNNYKFKNDIQQRFSQDTHLRDHHHEYPNHPHNNNNNNNNINTNNSSNTNNFQQRQQQQQQQQNDNLQHQLIDSDHHMDDNEKHKTNNMEKMIRFNVNGDNKNNNNKNNKDINEKVPLMNGQLLMNGHKKWKINSEFMECSSCEDKHSSNNTNGISTTGYGTKFERLTAAIPPTATTSASSSNTTTTSIITAAATQSSSSSIVPSLAATSTDTPAPATGTGTAVAIINQQYHHQQQQQQKINSTILHNAVPIFALHSQGRYYIPLTVEYDALLPYLNGHDLLDKTFGSIIPPLHSININVSFAQYHPKININNNNNNQNNNSNNKVQQKLEQLCHTTKPKLENSINGW